MLGLDDDLTFVHAELTKSSHVPHLSHLRDAAADSVEAAQKALVAAAADRLTAHSSEGSR